MTLTQARTAAMHSPLCKGCATMEPVAPSAAMFHHGETREVENADGGVYGSVSKVLSPQPPLTFHLACLKEDYMLEDDDELRVNERN